MCDCPTLEHCEALLAAAVVQANGMRTLTSGLPPICEMEPYRQGATEAQKKCHTAQNLSMLGKWFYCATQPDPTACFDGACDDLDTAVDECYAA